MTPHEKAMNIASLREIGSRLRNRYPTNPNVAAVVDRLTVLTDNIESATTSDEESYHATVAIAYIDSIDEATLALIDE